MSDGVKGHFSPEEAAQIHQAIAAAHSPLVCPRCGQALTSGLPGGRCSRHDVWALHCDICHQSLIVEDAEHPTHQASPNLPKSQGQTLN